MPTCSLSVDSIVVRWNQPVSPYFFFNDRIDHFYLLCLRQEKWQKRRNIYLTSKNTKDPKGFSFKGWGLTA